MQCIQSYSSQEPDELSIEMADVLNLLERTDDGMQKHISDFISGLKYNYSCLMKTSYMRVVFFSIFTLVLLCLLYSRLDDG